MRAIAPGFKPEIDGEAWVVVKAAHKLDDNGLVASLELGCQPKGVDSAPEGPAATQ